MTFVEVEYRTYGVSWRQSYCCTRGNYIQCDFRFDLFYSFSCSFWNIF